MVRYLIQRPIAVLMCFGVLLILGLGALRMLPVSLLPDVDVPRMVIRVNYPNTSALQLEQNVVQAIRENLLTLPRLKQIESKSANHSALLYLYFEYGTRMDLAYIEVNERLDHLSGQLPRDMARPQAVRINTSDVPVIRLQVVPKRGEDYAQVSKLTEKVLKKRLEQLDGVSLVDVNGRRGSYLSVVPDRQALAAAGLEESDLAAIIQSANGDLGSLAVRDGAYRYFVRVGNALSGPDALARLPVRLPGGASAPLGRLARVDSEVDPPEGYHLYNGREGLVLTIHKQPQAKMTELGPRIRAQAEAFRRDYPEADFALTQDQHFLLRAGIDNLYQDLFFGSVLAIAVLFLFLGNYASPSLMSISIPVSLVITFVFFRWFGLSLNIISLSGLALGIGMLIDNSIIVLDNITRLRRTGLPMLESCDEGVREVVAPVVSQVLTTVAVYAPLVLLSGLAGALVADQAIALTISLGVSLLVAFVLAPLLYRLFLRRDPAQLREDTRFYRWVSAGYHRMIRYIFRHKAPFFGFTCLLGIAGIAMALRAPVAALPRMEQRDTQLRIDWNEPIDTDENLRRTCALDALARRTHARVREAEVGVRQFLLQADDQGATQSLLYLACGSQREKEALDRQLTAWLREHFPRAVFQLSAAPNAFTQLFASDEPYFEARFRPANGEWTPQVSEALLAALPSLPIKDWQPGEGLRRETALELALDQERMALYGVSWPAVQDRLRQLFGEYVISEIKRFGEVTAIRFEGQKGGLSAKLSASVPGRGGERYALDQLLRVSESGAFAAYTADKGGLYQSIWFDDPTLNYRDLQRRLNAWAAANGFTATFAGRYFETREHARQLLWVFGISVLLLYVILAAQFENLLHPLLVMLTMPLGIFGSMLLLRLNGAAVDVMAAIGFVVVLGIIVDDPILKVDTINRLRRQYAREGLSRREALEKAIHEAGEICLKPLLMTSLTTSLALAPVLFTSGLGAELQKTLVYVIIGGLTLGTFFTTWFVPLGYWLVTSRKEL